MIYTLGIAMQRRRLRFYVIPKEFTFVIQTLQYRTLQCMRRETIPVSAAWRRKQTFNPNLIPIHKSTPPQAQEKKHIKKPTNRHQWCEMWGKNPTICGDISWNIPFFY